VDNLRTAPEKPTYVKVASPQTPRMAGPRLGIQPTYGDDKDGVLISGTSPDTPAAKAGLKEGDRIIEISGKPVKNLEAYMSLMAGHKKGDTLSVLILRDGKKMDVKVKLE
jgi:S1-C subfamily serine protease